MNRSVANVMSFKRVMELMQQDREDEARELLKALQDEFLSLHEENEVLRQQLQEVASVLDLAESMEFDGQKYWMREGGECSGPYCQVCYDREALLVRLQRKDKHWECQSCRNIYLDTRRKEDNPPKPRFSRLTFKTPLQLVVK